MTATREIQKAVSDAVALVNTRPGNTSIRLRFADDPYELDFVANAARCCDGRFEFQAGYETYGGNLEELSDIRAEVIAH